MIAPVRSKIPLLLVCAFFAVAGIAQEPGGRDPEPGALLLDAENLTDSLFMSESAQGAGGDAAEEAGEPVALVGGGEAGRRGRWRVTPHLDARATYDDNIFIQPKDRIDDFIFTFAPGLGVGFWDSDEERERYLDRQRGAAVVERSRGTFLVVDYTAILLGFARTTSQNAVDHDGLVDLRWESGKLTLGARLHLESKSETNTDVGTRIRRRTLTAEATSSYRITDKTALGLAFFHKTNDPEDFLRTVEWRGEGSVDYAPTPVVRFGFGVAAGRVQVESSADQTFERLLARAGYSLSEKLEAEFRGGVEFRQSDGPVGDRTSPIFDLRAVWTPAAGTQVALEGFRRVEASAARPDQDYTLTGAALTFRQALRGGLHFAVEGGYHHARYIGDARTDRYFFVRPGLFYNFAAWGNAGIAYERRRNESNRERSEFENNQTTFEIGLIY